jgi:hypothetical protein
MNSLTWRKAGVYVLVALPALSLGGIAVIAQQQDASQQPAVDPVADAARKAREQKKEAPKPKKVYTNEDLGSGGGPAAPAATSSAGASTNPNTKTKENPEGQADGGKVPTDKTAGGGKTDEEKWRTLFREERAKLALAEKELDILQREAQKAQTQYYSDPQKAMNEQLHRTEINEKDSQIAQKKQEVAQQKQKISDLEDDLRRSGGEIGWAREK